MLLTFFWQETLFPGKTQMWLGSLLRLLCILFGNPAIIRQPQKIVRRCMMIFRQADENLCGNVPLPELIIAVNLLLALLLAAGGFARVFPVHPTNGSARFNAPEYIQPLLIQGLCPPGSDEDVTSFKSKAPPPDPGTHLAASTSPPVPPLTQGRLCSLIPECPRPSWRGLLPFPLPPPSP